MRQVPSLLGEVRRRTKALYDACMSVEAMVDPVTMAHPAQRPRPRARSAGHAARSSRIPGSAAARTESPPPARPARVPGCAPAAAAGNRGSPVPPQSGASVSPKIATGTMACGSSINSVIGLLVVGILTRVPTAATPTAVSTPQTTTMKRRHAKAGPAQRTARTAAGIGRERAGPAPRRAST